MNTRKSNKSNNKHNKTQKYSKIRKKNGWSLVTIKGTPYDRGFQHGSILYNEINKILTFFPKFVIKEMNYDSYNEYLETSNKIIPIIKSNCNEIYEEMEGIVAGALSKGVVLNIEFIIGWNLSISLWKSHTTQDKKHKKHHDKKPARCSSFIATGSYTESGEIVMGHNTHTDFVLGQFENVIMRIYPDKGHSFVMQTSPGLIWSLTDWFITDAGIIGCESTISDLNYEPKFGLPIFCRIRKIMQYAKTLDECTKIMKTKSAGDYACSWLFGNIYTNEIMIYEAGLYNHIAQKTKNGVYYAANSAIDPIIRAKETTDKSFFDITNSSGARMLRLGQLLTIDYLGKLNAESAKKIIADHYDVNLKKDNPDNNTICNHAYQLLKHPMPFGAIDGKITTSALAKKGIFFGRWGSSCGLPFNSKKFLKKNIKYNYWKDFLPDFPKQPWVKISI